MRAKVMRNGCLLMGLAFFAVDFGPVAAYSGNVTISPVAPNASLSTNLQPRQSAVFSVTILSGWGYALKSGPTADITPKGKDWAWTGGPTTFYVLNESPEEASTVANVSCVWGPVGGPGPGPTPPDIAGSAVGTAELKIAHIEWTIAPKVQVSDGESEINWEVKLLNDYGELVSGPDIGPDFSMNAVNVSPAADWTIEPESGLVPELDGTVTSADPSRGNLRVDYTYFGAEKNSVSEEIAFVRGVAFA